ncbi:unnamed protein product [Spodoptera exigua]|nr:unnamed protein product [Spodoptera exigua]
MCILFIYNGNNDSRSDYSLILASNRDEYYDRPSKNMGPWIEDPNVFGGRDLEVDEGGTWLALAPLRKKLGVLLNLPTAKKPEAKSRGRIVADFVKNDKPMKTNALPIISTYNNANDELIIHKDAFLGFSNNLPEQPLKKVEAGRNKLQQIISTFNKVCMQDELIERLIDLLKWEESHLPDHQLETRRPNLYKELSSVFVCIPQGRYGTRTHTIVLVTKSGHMNVIEMTLVAPIDPENPKWIKTEYQFDMDMK